MRGGRSAKGDAFSVARTFISVTSITKMRPKAAMQLVLLCITTCLSATSWAFSSGQLTGTCNGCHMPATGAASTGTITFASPFTGDTTLKVGQTYQITYNNNSTAPYAGFNLNDGALNSSFVQLTDPITSNGDAISHSYNTLDAGYPASIARKDWTFSWTPNVAATNQQFSWCSLAIDGTGGTGGDGPETCASSATFLVEVNQQPVFATTTVDLVFLATSSAASRTITGVVATDGNTSDAISYQFTPATDLSDASINNPIYQGSGARTYTVTASDEIGPSSNSVTVNVDIDPIPTAAITGNPASISEGTSVTLQGNTSTDNINSTDAGTIASFAWNVSRPSNANYATGTSSDITFTTPLLAPNTSEDLTIDLTVTDSAGQTNTQQITIQVNDIAVGDAPPTISSLVASTPQNENVTITLTAVASDVEDDPLPNSAFNWSVTTGQTVTLSGTGATRSFSYDISDPNTASDTINFRLIVTDSVNQTDQQDVAVAVNNGPSADAGTDDIADEGDTVNISASASFDPGGGALTYAWTQVSGPTVSFANANAADTTFVAPDVGRNGDTVVLQVEVTDLGNLSDTATVSIDVSNVNAAPTAIAGDDQTVDENTSVTLSGDFTDPDDPGSTITFAWTQTSGTTVSLTGANTASPSFTAPEVPAAGDTLVFSLVVTDEGLLASAADTVTITVDNVNRPPTADAGPDQSVAEGATASLNGSNSDDDDDRANLGYAWSQLSGPTITLSNASIANPTFDAPLIGFDDDPVVALRLTVTDLPGLTDTDDVLVNITNFNTAPTANAGPDQTVNESGNSPNTVTLDARGSTDADIPNDDALSFAWTQASGPSVTLTGADTDSPTFAAPSVNSSGVALSFQVTVTDRGGLADTDAVIVNVVDVSIPPVAAAGPDQDVNEGATVNLSADNSSDIDGSIDTFAWRQSSGPAITLSSPNSSNTSFTAPRVGDNATIGLQLTVTDNEGLQDTDDLLVNVLDQTEESPVANAGTDQIVTELDTVTLDGSASSDLDGNIASFLWTQVEGTGVELSDPTQIAPTFTAPAVDSTGTALVFQLDVTDSSTLSASDTVIVNITNNAQPPSANAGADQTADEGTTVTLDASASSDPFGTALTYLWQQSAGPNVVLSDPTDVAPTFVAPGIPASASGSIVSFEVTVTSENLMASDSVDITITDNGITGFDDALPTLTTSDNDTIALSVDNGNLVAVQAVDAASITETDNRPETFYSDLVDIDVTVTTPGDTAVVTILFASPLPADAVWAKYSPTGGWVDFSANVSIASDGLSADITLTDGGSGDDDGVANGRIIDPSGPAVFSTPPATVTPPAQANTPRSSSGGGCSVTQGPADPSLPILLALGLLYFVRRRLRR